MFSDLPKHLQNNQLLVTSAGNFYGTVLIIIHFVLGRVNGWPILHVEIKAEIIILISLSHK